MEQEPFCWYEYRQSKINAPTVRINWKCLPACSIVVLYHSLMVSRASTPTLIMLSCDDTSSYRSPIKSNHLCNTEQVKLQGSKIGSPMLFFSFILFFLQLRVHITFEFHDFPNFFHFWYSKTTILSENKNAFKLKKIKFKAEI